jgi:uncharacterized protein YjbJ (UPF0337 family)
MTVSIRPGAVDRSIKSIRQRPLLEPVMPWASRRWEGNLMSALDKAKNKAEEVGGKAKEHAGEATGDDNLRAEGEADQAKGNLKQAGEKVKDVFKD